MDDYGNNNNTTTLIIGVILGLIVLFFIIPLSANMIATNQVADAANSALSNMDTYDTSLPSTANSVLPTATEPTTQNTQKTSVLDDNKQETKTTQSSTVSTDGMRILSGSITTGSSLSSKSVCKVFVGKEYSGAKVKISTIYSRDGTDLNAGNIIDKTVDSSGYITLKAADSYDLYPDECLITIFDSNTNELDYHRVYLETESGTQTF